MIPTAPSRPALVLFGLALGTIASSAFLEDGLVLANSNTESGATIAASEILNLSEVFVGGPGIGTASASVNGPMNGEITLNSTASITSVQNQGASTSDAEFRLTDTLLVNAPGFSNGTTVMAKIAVEVDGSVSGFSSGAASRQAIARVAGPLESWAQETGNIGAPPQFDPDGQVIFTIPLKIGQAVTNNLSLSVLVASSTNRNPDAEPGVSYSANASAGLGFQLGTVQEIFTENGIKVYGWTISAVSGLDYGEGEPLPPLPPDPLLTISPSEVTSGDLTVGWEANPALALIVQSSSDARTWTRKLDILDTTGSFEVDPLAPGDRYFRITTVNPTGPLTEPLLKISYVREDEKVFVSWRAHAAETYRLQTAILRSPLVWEDLQTVSGTTGPVSFEAEPSNATRVFRLLSSFTNP